jgi:hypothetical protein
MATYDHGIPSGLGKTMGMRDEPTSRYYILTNKGKPMSGDVYAGFRKYNVLDYRSPVETFDMSAIDDAIDYANRLIEHGMQGEPVGADEVTVSVFRAYQNARVIEVFEELRSRDALVEGDAPGIYRLSPAVSNLPVQIVIMGELEGEDNLFWRALSDKANKSDMEQAIRRVYMLEDEQRAGDGRTYIETILRGNPDLALEIFDDAEMAYMLCDILGLGEKAGHPVASSTLGT